MFGVFAAKRSRVSATKVEHQPLSKKIWYYVKYYVFLPIFLLMILYCWQYLQHHQPFPIKNVTVIDKAAHVDAKAVKRIALPDVDTGFFRLNVEDLQAQLSALPWVSQATVTRQWPDKVVIRFNEYQPVASWNKTALITPNGTVFTPNLQSDIPSTLPLLNGPDADAQEILAGYQSMAEMLRPLHLQIKELDVSDRFAWKVLLDNGMQINLGEQYPLKHFQTFVGIYPQVFTQTNEQADYVDMRYDHGMAVHWIKASSNHSS